MLAPGQAFSSEYGVPQSDVNPAINSITGTAPGSASSASGAGYPLTSPYSLGLSGGATAGYKCWSCWYNRRWRLHVHLESA